MISPERAFQVLERANPVPTIDQVDKPSAAEALFRARESATGVVRPARGTGRGPARGLAIAAAVFVVVVVAGWAIGQLLSTEAPIVENPDPTIPQPATTAPIDTSALPADMAEAVAAFATTYSAGDFAALEALLEPGASYVWIRSSDLQGGVPWTRQELSARFQIDAALNTTIELSSCALLAEGRVACEVGRTDDLTRAKGVTPDRDVIWRLELDGGLVTSWTELTPDVSSYFEMAREPFHAWLRSAHHEIEDPATDLRGQPWRPDTGFAAIAPALIDEYRQALAVEPQIGEDPQPEFAAWIADLESSYGTAGLSDLLAPGFTYVWSREEGAVQELTAQEWLIINEIDQAINTEITLGNCFVVGPSRSRCNILRVDDLARVRNLPQTTNRETPSFRDVIWELAFDDGQLTLLAELGPGESQFYVAAREAFETWVEAERPDIPSPIASQRDGPWRTDIGLEEVMAELVAQWAQSEGVTLDEG